MQNLELPSVGGKKIVICQPGIDDIGGVVWDCGRVLVHLLLEENFIETMKFAFPMRPLIDVDVVDLGSGTGVVGIQMAALGYTTTLTDRENFRSLLCHNASINNEIVGNRISVDTFDWTMCETKTYFPCDILIASDCVYDWETLDSFLNCLEKIMDDKTVLLFAYEDREDEITKEMLQRLETLVTYEEVQQSPKYNCDFVTVMMMRKK